MQAECAEPMNDHNKEATKTIAGPIGCPYIRFYCTGYSCAACSVKDSVQVYWMLYSWIHRKVECLSGWDLEAKYANRPDSETAVWDYFRTSLIEFSELSSSHAFPASGLHVVATARDEKADLNGIGIEVLPLELNSPEAIADVKKHIFKRTRSSLDYLINNAGRNSTIPGLDIDFDEVQDVFDTNIISVLRMCQAFSPLLMQAKGTIINVGSVAGEIPYVYGLVYNATKAALHAYSDTLRIELAPFDVRVMVVVTGGVTSNIVKRSESCPPNRRISHSKKGTKPDSFIRKCRQWGLRPMQLLLWRQPSRRSLQDRYGKATRLGRFGWLSHFMPRVF